MNHETVTVSLRDLADVYAVVDAFREMMAGDVLQKTGVLYMDGKRQGLESACGMLGKLIGLEGFRRLAVQGRSERDALGEAYGRAAACAANARPDTELEAICMNLCSAAYAALNETYETSAQAENAVGRVLEASRFALELLDGLDAAGKNALAPMALDPDGPLPCGDETVRGAFLALQPRYDPEKPNEEGPHEEP